MQTITRTQTHTSTHALHIASKVAADLKRMQRIYRKNIPSNQEIQDYQTELANLLYMGYMDTVTYGFNRNGKWVIALKYQSVDGNLIGSSDDPGGVGSVVNIDGSSFTSFLSYSTSWSKLSDSEREDFYRTLPFKRVEGQEPQIESGWWVESRRYQSGELGVKRSMIKRI